MISQGLVEDSPAPSREGEGQVSPFPHPGSGEHVMTAPPMATHQSSSPGLRPQAGSVREEGWLEAVGGGVQLSRARQWRGMLTKCPWRGLGAVPTPAPDPAHGLSRVLRRFYTRCIHHVPFLLPAPGFLISTRCPEMCRAGRTQ